MYHIHQVSISFITCFSKQELYYEVDGNEADVVDWLTGSCTGLTAVCEVEGSIPGEGMFSEILSPASTFLCKYMDTSKVKIVKPNTVRRSNYKGTSCVSIILEHVN